MRYNTTPKTVWLLNKRMVSVPRKVMVRYKRESRGRQLPYNVFMLVKAERACTRMPLYYSENVKTFLVRRVCLPHTIYSLFKQPRKNGGRKGEGALFRDSREEKGC